MHRMTPDQLAASISTIMRMLRGGVNAHGSGLVEREGFAARVWEDGGGFAWQVRGATEPSRPVAAGHSEFLETACASAALRLTQANDGEP